MALLMKCQQPAPIRQRDHEGGRILEREPRFSARFQWLLDAPETALAAIKADPVAFEQQVLAEQPAVPSPAMGLFHLGAVAFLLFGPDGARLPLDAPAWVPALRSFGELEGAAISRDGAGRLMAIPGVGGRLLHLLWAPVDEAMAWNLPDQVRDAARHAASRIVIVAGGAQDEGPLETAIRGFGLPNLEGRVVAAVVRTGNSREAAAELGLAYATVRAALSQAARRMRQPNMPAVVSTVVAAAFGILPDDANGPALLADILQLTPRQAQIALLVASGVSRDNTAHAVGVSAAVVKKELDLIFASLGLASAAELSRLIVEVQALGMLGRATDGATGFLDPSIEPARFTVRPNRREVIGWSDHGPASGRPVLVVHSNWQCRYVPRPLLRALHRQGWRPIAIDRPGFGSTSPGRSTSADPFGQAVDDTLLILDQLGIARTAIVARDGSQFVHVLKAAAPDRIGPVVLVSPTLPTSASSKRIGIIGTMKEVFLRPQLTELYFRIVCQQLTLARLEHLTRSLTIGSGVDSALCDDPAFIRDRFRAMRPFATGNLIGGVNEEAVISRGGYEFPAIDPDDWVMVQGDDDNHNSFDDVVAHWRPILPSTPIVRVPGGGRFMTSSHPELIVEQLQMADRRR
jgi:pimeloyl-ACP methyl ester carboxylesterase/FixJ family two-component response regulator